MASSAAALRVTARMATWWQCSIMLAFTALFGWIVQMGLSSTGPDTWPHVLIPPYALWLYATLAALVNRRSVVIARGALVASNGPVVLRPRTRIAREDVVCAYFAPVMTTSDSGDTVVLWYTTGVETRAGAHVQVFGTFDDGESARAAARRIADAFGSGPSGLRIGVRALTNLADDPAETRVVRMWVGITLAAVVAGVLWDLAYR